MEGQYLAAGFVMAALADTGFDPFSLPKYSLLRPRVRSILASFFFEYLSKEKIWISQAPYDGLHLCRVNTETDLDHPHSRLAGKRRAATDNLRPQPQPSLD